MNVPRATEVEAGSRGETRGWFDPFLDLFPELAGDPVCPLGVEVSGSDLPCAARNGANPPQVGAP